MHRIRIVAAVAAFVVVAGCGSMSSATSSATTTSIATTTLPATTTTVRQTTTVQRTTTERATTTVVVAKVQISFATDEYTKECVDSIRTLVNDPPTATTSLGQTLEEPCTHAVDSLQLDVGDQIKAKGSDSQTLFVALSAAPLYPAQAVAYYGQNGSTSPLIVDNFETKWVPQVDAARKALRAGEPRQQPTTDADSPTTTLSGTIDAEDGIATEAEFAAISATLLDGKKDSSGVRWTKYMTAEVVAKITPGICQAISVATSRSQAMTLLRSGLTSTNYTDEDITMWLAVGAAAGCQSAWDSLN